MPTDQLEARVTSLEAALAEMQRELATIRSTAKGDWLEKVAGAFSDDPEFAETVRIGRYYNEHGRLPEEYEDVKCP